MADTTFLIESSSRVEIAAPALEVIDGHVTTTSQQIAKHFGKRHTNVLRDIKNLLEDLPQGYGLNFEPIQIDTDLGMGRIRKDPAYRITRDGFTLLAMGFTGKDAMRWKVAYIAAFNKMERELTELSNQRPSPLDRARLMMVIENGQITNTIHLGKWDIIVDPNSRESLDQLLRLYLTDDMIPTALETLHKRVIRKYQMSSVQAEQRAS